MATPPARTELSDTYPNPSNAVMRTGMGKFWDYVTGLLGATGDAEDARTALGATLIGSSVFTAADEAAARAAIGAATGQRVTGLRGNVNATTPLTKFDLSADIVTLRDTNGGAVTRYNTGTHTVDLNLAGPIAAGRDQAGAFPANSWVHLYWVWNGTVLGIVASLSLPTVGPTLPPGCTHWCYATTIRWNASSNIVPANAKGAKVYYDVISFGATSALSNGAATTMTAVSLASLVPPNAIRVTVLALITVQHNAASSNFRLYARPTGSATGGYVLVDLYTQVAGVISSSGSQAEMPLLSQSVEYRISASPSTLGGAFLDIQGYTVPNGDA